MSNISLISKEAKNVFVSYSLLYLFICLLYIQYTTIFLQKIVLESECLRLFCVRRIILILSNIIS